MSADTKNAIFYFNGKKIGYTEMIDTVYQNWGMWNDLYNELIPPVFGKNLYAPFVSIWGVNAEKYMTLTEQTLLMAKKQCTDCESCHNNCAIHKNFQLLLDYAMIGASLRMLYQDMINSIFDGDTTAAKQYFARLEFSPSLRHEFEISVKCPVVYSKYLNQGHRGDVEPTPTNFKLTNDNEFYNVKLPSWLSTLAYQGMIMIHNDGEDEHGAWDEYRVVLSTRSRIDAIIVFRIHRETKMGIVTINELSALGWAYGTIHKDLWKRFIGNGEVITFADKKPKSKDDIKNFILDTFKDFKVNFSLDELLDAIMQGEAGHTAIHELTTLHSNLSFNILWCMNLPGIIN